MSLPAEGGIGPVAVSQPGAEGHFVSLDELPVDRSGSIVGREDRPSSVEPQWSGPIRTCVACRVRAPQASLMRLAWDGQVVQVSRTASGRGAWLHPTAACVQGAQKKGVLSRAFRTAVPVDAIDTAVLDEFVEKSL